MRTGVGGAAARTGSSRSCQTRRRNTWPPHSTSSQLGVAWQSAPVASASTALSFRYHAASACATASAVSGHADDDSSVTTASCTGTYGGTSARVLPRPSKAGGTGGNAGTSSGTATKGAVARRPGPVPTTLTMSSGRFSSDCGRQAGMRHNTFALDERRSRVRSAMVHVLALP